MLEDWESTDWLEVANIIAPMGEESSPLPGCKRVWFIVEWGRETECGYCGGEIDGDHCSQCGREMPTDIECIDNLPEQLIEKDMILGWLYHNFYTVRVKPKGALL